METYEIFLICKMRVKASTSQKAMMIASKLFDDSLVSASQCTVTWNTAEKPLRESEGEWKIEDPR